MNELYDILSIKLGFFVGFFVCFFFFRKEKLTQCYMAVILQFFKRLNFKDFKSPKCYRK